MNELYVLTDSALIWLYRVPGEPILGYYLGTFAVALACVVAGFLTVYLAHAVNGRVLSGSADEMVRMNNASIRALGARDKESYTACNKMANDAFGRYFFSRMALGAASLWPVPFALEWMQGRFGDVPFALPVAVPGIGDSVGFVFTFVLFYILAHKAFGAVRHRLPLFSAMDRKVREASVAPGRLLSVADISAGREA